MPNVGGKKFGYSPAGRRSAKKYARETGQPMKSRGGYGQGVDRRGGARTGMLSKASRSPGMGSRFKGNSTRRGGSISEENFKEKWGQYAPGGLHPINWQGGPNPPTGGTGLYPTPPGIQPGGNRKRAPQLRKPLPIGRRSGSRPRPRFGMNSGPGMGKRRGY